MSFEMVLRKALEVLALYGVKEDSRVFKAFKSVGPESLPTPSERKTVTTKEVKYAKRGRKRQPQRRQPQRRQPQRRGNSTRACDAPIKNVIVCDDEEPYNLKPSLEKYNCPSKFDKSDEYRPKKKKSNTAAKNQKERKNEPKKLKNGKKPAETEEYEYKTGEFFQPNFAKRGRFLQKFLYKNTPEAAGSPSSFNTENIVIPSDCGVTTHRKPPSKEILCPNFRVRILKPILTDKSHKRTKKAGKRKRGRRFKNEATFDNNLSEDTDDDLYRDRHDRFEADELRVTRTSYPKEPRRRRKKKSDDGGANISEIEDDSVAPFPPRKWPLPDGLYED